MATKAAARFKAQHTRRLDRKPPSAESFWLIDQYLSDPNFESVVRAFETWEILRTERDYRIALLGDNCQDEDVDALADLYAVRGKIIHAVTQMKAASLRDIYHKIRLAMDSIAEHDNDFEESTDYEVLRSVLRDVGRLEAPSRGAL